MGHRRRKQRGRQGKHQSHRGSASSDLITGPFVGVMQASFLRDLMVNIDIIAETCPNHLVPSDQMGTIFDACRAEGYRIHLDGDLIIVEDVDGAKASDQSFAEVEQAILQAAHQAGADEVEGEINPDLPDPIHPPYQADFGGFDADEEGAPPPSRLRMR